MVSGGLTAALSMKRLQALIADSSINPPRVESFVHDLGEY
jgi:ABC-type amino acid transport substrate-binding protein